MGQAMTAGGDASAAATMPATMAMGFGMAQEMMRSMQQGQTATPPPLPGAVAAPAAAPAATVAGGALEVLTPEQAAHALGVSVEDVMVAIEAGDLKARKIGSAWRIAKAALEDFLRG